MSFIRRLITSNAGVIAMETVMTLPIYLVLLGGGAWIAELSTGKSTLTAVQYTHCGLFVIRNMDDASSRKILEDATVNVANSTFVSSANTNERGWWREVTVNDTLTMKPASILKNMFSAMDGKNGSQSSLTDLTMGGTMQVRYVRAYNERWRGSEYGNELCNGLVNEIYNQSGPGEPDGVVAPLSIPSISYYKSSAMEYSTYLFTYSSNDTYDQVVLNDLKNTDYNKYLYEARNSRYSYKYLYGER